MVVAVKGLEKVVGKEGGVREEDRQDVKEENDDDEESQGPEGEGEHSRGQDEQRRGGARTKTVSLEELSKYFHLPIDSAARELKMCVTVLKKQCRASGIKRWPHRKLRALDKLAQKLQSKNNAEIQSLAKKKTDIFNAVMSKQQDSLPSDGAPTPEEPADSVADGERLQTDADKEVKSEGDSTTRGSMPPTGQVHRCPTEYRDCMYTMSTNQAPFHSGVPYHTAMQGGYTYPQQMMYGYPPVQTYTDRNEAAYVRGMVAPYPAEYATMYGVQYGHARFPTAPTYYVQHPYENRGVPTFGGYAYGDRQENGASRTAPVESKEQGSAEEGDLNKDTQLHTSVVSSETGSGGRRPQSAKQPATSCEKVNGPTEGRIDGADAPRAITVSKAKRNLAERQEEGAKAKRPRRTDYKADEPIHDRSSDDNSKESAVGMQTKTGESPSSAKKANGSWELIRAEQVRSLVKALDLPSLHLTVWTTDQDLVVNNIEGPEVRGIHGGFVRVGESVGHKRDLDSMKPEASTRTNIAALNGETLTSCFTADGVRLVQVAGPLRDASGDEIVGVCGISAKYAA